LKIGISTGGGDCPGLNAAIRAIVKYASLKHNAHLIGICDSFEGLRNRPLRTRNLILTDVSDILWKGGTILGTYNTHAISKNSRHFKDDISLICEGYHSLELDALIVIGGEGTQSVAQHLVERGLSIVGIPKTIDNDLPKTEQTIGFSTCVDLVAQSISCLQSTAESHDRVMVLEVMGRDSGYIALYGGLSGGAHIILIPEIAFSYESVCQKIKERKKIGRNYSVIVVAEGARPKGFSAKPSGNSFSAGRMVAEKIEHMLKIETRVTVLGHLQRGGSPNPTDRLLATRFGVHAVDLVIQKKFSRITIVKNGKISDTPYKNIRKWERRMIHNQDEQLLSSEAVGICLGR